MKFKIRKLFLIGIIFALSSCGVRNENVTVAYLNKEYRLVRCGDLHGISPTSEEVISRNKGFTPYTPLFDTKTSFINFECKGTSFDDFYCEGSMLLCDAKSNVVFKIDSFRCHYQGYQSGTIIYDNNAHKEVIGTIYVYTPYWCRWQYYYDVDGSGEKILLTFEFWKYKVNPLPNFLVNK